MNLDGDLLFYLIGGLAFLCIAGVGLAFTGNGESEKASKRARQLASGEPTGRTDRYAPNAARKKQTQQMLKK